MAEFKTPFIKKKGDTLFYSGEGEFVFIVPEMYFEPSRKCAIIEGEYINLFGTIDYTILKNNETDVTKRSHKFFYPTMYYTKPGRMEKVKGLKLNNDDPEDYRLLFYKDNDIDEIVTSTKTPQNVEYVERMFHLYVENGHINRNIPYDKLQEYFFENARLNGISYKISAQLFGIMISELCRDPSNLSRKFSLSKAIDDGMNLYKPIPIKEVPKFISPYQAIVSENWDEGIVGAIMNDNNIASPMEKIMTK